MNQNKRELFEICSLPDPNEEQIKKLSKIVQEDTAGLINVVDENGHSPLLLMCRNNRSKSLLHCIQEITSKNRSNRSGGTDAVITEQNITEINVNYQDRDGFNALHYACMNYKEDELFDVIKLLISCGVDPNKTDREFDQNPLQLLLKHSKQRDLFGIVLFMVEMGVNLKHKDKMGETGLDYLGKCYQLTNVIKVIRLLTENGEVPNDINEMYSSSPVFDKSGNNEPEVVSVSDDATDVGSNSCLIF